MKKTIVAQFVVLLAGTLFAWGNFVWELVDWLGKRACTLGCPTAPGTNPFLTPCFYGALFFTLAFVLSAVILARSRRRAS
jgi:hypothetical protein